MCIYIHRHIHLLCTRAQVPVKVCHVFALSHIGLQLGHMFLVTWRATWLFWLHSGFFFVAVKILKRSSVLSHEVPEETGQSKAKTCVEATCQKCQKGSWDERSSEKEYRSSRPRDLCGEVENMGWERECAREGHWSHVETKRLAETWFLLVVLPIVHQVRQRSRLDWMWTIQSKNARHVGHCHTCQFARRFPAPIWRKRVFVDFGSEGNSAAKKGIVSYEPPQSPLPPTAYRTGSGLENFGLVSIG